MFPFLDRMEARYHRLPTAKKSRTMQQRLCDEGLEKLVADSQIGPMNAFNSCKLDRFLIPKHDTTDMKIDE